MAAKKHQLKDENPIMRYGRLMPRRSSTDLLVLKAHLLIEEQLQLIIADHFGSADFLDEARFSFFQKLLIVQAIAGNSGTNHRVWSAIEKLNKLRNSMAHNVEAENLAKEIDDFISLWAEKEYKPSATPKERASQLRETLGGLYGWLIAVRLTMHPKGMEYLGQSWQQAKT